MKLKLYKYTVSGPGRFPLDMLRYDRAAPFATDDVSKIEDSVSNGDMGRPYYVIILISHRIPTAARWQSFGWTLDLPSLQEA
jgi:hypothetical protein